MASLAKKFILVLLAVTFVLGQTIRPTIFGVQVTLIDILLPALAALHLFTSLSQRKPANHPSFIVFLTIAWIGLIVNLLLRHLAPLIPIFYLLRLTSLIIFFIFPLTLDHTLEHIFILTIFANLIFGFVQYFLWPDFTYFSALQWDPHLYRLVSTFFDPTFTALIYLLFGLHLLSSHLQPRYKITFTFLIYLAIAFTYSRSTLLAIVVVSFFYSLVKKNFKVFLVAIVIVVATIFLLPRHLGEGTKLERTSSIFAKIENYKLAASAISQSPLIGFGYNTLAQTALISTQSVSHAASGFDNSLLIILATTGLIGFIPFILGLWSTFRRSSLLYQTAFVAVLFHSLFANSLLYPWVLFYLVLILSLPKYRT